MPILENPPQVTVAPSTSGAPESVAGDVKQKLGEVLISEVPTEKKPRSNRLLGHNSEVTLLGEGGTGILKPIIKDTSFPSGVILRGRNLLVTEYWDDSLRVEIIKTANDPRDPRISPGSDRLIGSSLVVVSEGTEHHNPTVIFDKNGAMTLVRDSK